MTSLGKILVYVLSAGSLTALGICLWLYIDYKPLKDRQAQIDSLKNEIKQKFDAQAREAEALQLLAAEKRLEERLTDTPQVKEGEPFQLAKKAAVPVKEVRAALVKDEEDIEKLNATVANLQKDIQSLIEQISAQRGKTVLAYEEQKRLREAIEAPKIDGQPQKAFHVLIGDAQKEKQTAEQAQLALKPKLINGLAELSILQQRYEQLARRLEELKSSAAASAAGR